MIIYIRLHDTPNADTNWHMRLFDMYCKWAEKHGFDLEFAFDGNLIITINNEEAFDLLKSETGMHRLVRYDKDIKRSIHSFAIVIIKKNNNSQHPAETFPFSTQLNDHLVIKIYLENDEPRVKDLRTGYETRNLEGVLNGNIDEFLNVANEVKV